MYNVILPTEEKTVERINVASFVVSQLQDDSVGVWVVRLERGFIVTLTKNGMIGVDSLIGDVIYQEYKKNRILQIFQVKYGGVGLEFDISEVYLVDLRFYRGDIYEICGTDGLQVVSTNVANDVLRDCLESVDVQLSHLLGTKKEIHIFSKVKEVA